MELYPWQWLHSSRNDQLLQAGRRRLKVSQMRMRRHRDNVGVLNVTDVAGALPKM